MGACSSTMISINKLAHYDDILSDEYQQVNNSTHNVPKGKKEKPYLKGRFYYISRTKEKRKHGDCRFKGDVYQLLENHLSR